MRKRALVGVAVGVLLSGHALADQGPVEVVRVAPDVIELRRLRSLAEMAVVETEDRFGVGATLVFPPGADTLRVRTTGELEVVELRGQSRQPAGPSITSVPEPLGAGESPPPAGDGASSDWCHRGGTPARSGRSLAAGPTAELELWYGDPTVGPMGNPPAVVGKRVFVVRHRNPIEESLLVALDLDTGEAVWSTVVPFVAGNWRAWVVGGSEDQVYVSRAGNGNSVSAPVLAFDAGNGSFIWKSTAEIDADDLDGAVMAPGGDLIIGSFSTLARIDPADGATVWSVPRQCCVSQGCGASVVGDRVYTAEIGDGGGICGGGQRIAAFDLETGAPLHLSTTMPQGGSQNVPFANPGTGVIYFSRTSNSGGFDKLYAWRDSGSHFEPVWDVPAWHAAFSSYALGADGSVYVLGSGDTLLRLDPGDGSTIDSVSGLWFDIVWSPHMAIDLNGNVFLSNGSTSYTEAQLWAFDRQLAPLWDVQVPYAFYGGPALGRRGTLVFAPHSNDVRAYRVEALLADGFESGDTSAWSQAVQP